MTIEQRFEKLERANRRWRNTSVAMGLVMVAGLLMAQGGAVSDSIQTKRLEVVNAKGQPVVTLESGERGGRIITANLSGKIAFEVATGELAMYDDHGQRLAKISATKEGQGLMGTYNHRGEGVIILGATKEGKGALTTYNGAGQKQVSLSATDTGGAISVWNNNGQAISTIRTDENGHGEVGAWNGDGKGRKITPGR